MTYINSSFPHPNVLLLSLARPPVNAFSEPFWRELGETVDAASQNDEVRVVVLASQVDKGFTAGLDCESSEVAGGSYPLRDADGRVGGSR